MFRVREGPSPRLRRAKVNGKTGGPSPFFQNHAYVQSQATFFLLEDTQGVDIHFLNFREIAEKLGEAQKDFYHRFDVRRF